MSLTSSKENPVAASGCVIFIFFMRARKSSLSSLMFTSFGEVPRIFVFSPLFFR